MSPAISPVCTDTRCTRPVRQFDEDLVTVRLPHSFKKLGKRINSAEAARDRYAGELEQFVATTFVEHHSYFSRRIHNVVRRAFSQLTSDKMQRFTVAYVPLTWIKNPPPLEYQFADRITR